MRIITVLLAHYGESHRLVKEDYQDLLLPSLSSDNEMSSSVIQTNCDYNDRFQTWIQPAVRGREFIQS